MWLLPNNNFIHYFSEKRGGGLSVLPSEQTVKWKATKMVHNSHWTFSFSFLSQLQRLSLVIRYIWYEHAIRFLALINDQARLCVIKKKDFFCLVFFFLFFSLYISFTLQLTREVVDISHSLAVFIHSHTVYM